MPYSIRKGGGSCSKAEWAVVKTSTGKSVGCHKTKASARKQLAALQINVMSKEGTMSKLLHESTGRLEAAASADAPTRRTIQIITPGWGSSGYYSADVLERAAANRVIPAGTHMYLNHASESERHDRPERDVEKIGAVLIEDAQWDGHRLFAGADLIGPHSELIESLAPYIGVSIDGSATDITIGEAEGRRGKIIEDLAEVASVDFVTHAGRGGMVLLESARPSLVNARAVVHGVVETTVNDTREQLQNLLRDTYGAEKTWVWVRDFDDATVWYQLETPDSSATYGIAYEMDDAGTVALTGKPTEVRAKTEYVPATRPDSTTTTTEETTEVTMGKIQIEESEHNRLVEEAGRVDTLEAERDTEKARADAAEQKLAEAAGAAAGGGDDPTKPVVTGPRAVVEKHIQSQDDRIARLEAREGARQVVAEVLAEAWIGDAQKNRLSAVLMDDLPMTEEGKLDESALRTRATERVNEAETEAAEILSAAGVGTPRGLGALTTPATEAAGKQYEEELTESFRQRGMSDAAIETAVKGR